MFPQAVSSLRQADSRATLGAPPVLRPAPGSRGHPRGQLLSLAARPGSAEGSAGCGRLGATPADAAEAVPRQLDLQGASGGSVPPAAGQGAIGGGGGQPRGHQRFW